MGALDAIGPETAGTLFDVLVCMAWADRKLTPEEVSAARAAVVAFGLPERGAHLDDALHAPRPFEALALSSLHGRDADIVYLCAAWMALADREQATEETSMLAELRVALGLDEARAGWLASRAVDLRMTTPPSDSWWRELELLVVGAAKAIAHGDAPA
jgi:hypothetical protein